MAAPLQKYPYAGAATDEAVREHLRDASRADGGVWFYVAVFGQVTIYQFENRSAIPDAFVGMGGRGPLMTSGRETVFTPAQVRRESQRGIYTGDR